LKIIGAITVFLAGALLIYATVDFPPWADPASPASISPVSIRYIEKSVEETAVPNVVTSVLADYRGYDTMFETSVIFAAGLACFFLLRVSKREGPKELLFRHTLTGMTVRIKDEREIPADLDEFVRIDTTWTPHDLIIKTVCRVLLPFMQLFALYVIAHGHHSPGGGFQGGVILGASIILLAISLDLRTATTRFSEKVDGLLSSAGVLIYAGTGAICVLLGLNFLNYGALASILFVDPVMARSHGIFIVEIGVGITVMATMVWIYSNLASAGKYDEGL
jgi:multicomponent Na+:H+ antiporter subunit B